MASEVTALRVAFERRRERLNEAMEQLSEIAMRDELTGLYNRRYIMDVLSRQKALADRGTPVLHAVLLRSGSLQTDQRPLRPSGRRSGAA